MVKKRNTAQKKLIFSELEGRCDHPSVATLYEDLKKKNSHISLSTVYRVLNDAAGVGEVVRIHVGMEDHFDGNISGHCHLICTECGAILDEKFPTEALSALAERSGYRLFSTHAEFYGLCPDCRICAE